MKNLKYVPLILAALMYGVATYLILFVYLSYDYALLQFSEWTILFLVFGSVASYLYLSGSILVVGFFISDAIKRK
ncbi:hypothetical protein ES703_124220 [subsurface metagenome]